ncbi:hypothetical protein B5Z22_04310 [Bacillus velezensis]|nr:hypothetical protein B5Z20_09795 [Bacillus velezensis]OQV56616.1 hypothetical protein B5Z22_04310 [Bacillus velezensis]OQV63172.1 hypothetical protein B5Z24_04310 [Bacillus velezensis]
MANMLLSEIAKASPKIILVKSTFLNLNNIKRYVPHTGTSMGANSICLSINPMNLDSVGV